MSHGRLVSVTGTTLVVVVVSVTIGAGFQATAHVYLAAVQEVVRPLIDLCE